MLSEITARADEFDFRPATPARRALLMLMIELLNYRMEVSPDASAEALAPAHAPFGRA
jgi:hypothetical protein